MAYQPSVAHYFPTRKRPSTDVIKKDHPTKVLVLDSSQGSDKNNEQKNNESSITAPKIIFATHHKNNLSQFGQQNSSSRKFVRNVSSVVKNVSLRIKKDVKTSNENQVDIRKTFLKIKNSDADNKEEEALEQKYEDQVLGTQDILPSTPTKSQDNEFLKKDSLSPMKLKPFYLKTEEHGENGETKIVLEKEAHSKHEKDVEHKSDNEKDNSEITIQNKSIKEAENRNIVSRTEFLRKELNLGQIKAKLSRSSRLEEMKLALERINQSKIKLTNIQESLNKTNLEKSETVDLEIPYSSPMKTPVRNLASPRSASKFSPSRLFDEPPPVHISSPLKSPYKSPAFQRYQTLVTEGRSALTLPFKYRALAEMFHCVDTVVSMFHNRKETVTFAKLKPAVEEMKKRALTEYQLGQIKTIFPEGFEFRQEKIHKFGGMQSEKYDLVVSPILPVGDQGKPAVMTPTCLLERKRAFYNTLLDMTKTYHEEFLTGLDPPMHIPRHRLTRWHPNFDVDGVPDIMSGALPQPPNVEKIASAKDVLERSRSLFTANPRMQRALQRVSKSNESSSPSDLPTSISSSTTSLLKGIPKCLLEKVRAKQAAKAMEAMTRTPAQAKEAVRITRLPEIARIIRNLFVAEKKSVLPRDLVLKKLDDSYRENLTISDLDDHVKLLSDHVPGWMSFCNIRKTDYIKLSKNADMLRIMKRLESLAAEKEF